MNLNEGTIKSLPVPEAGHKITYFTGAKVQGSQAPAGFGCRVTKDGARSWILNYRVDGRERRLTIGAWPDWSALRAVREARELRRRIDRGDDPLAKPAASLTINEVLDQFIARHVRSKERPLRSAVTVESALRRFVRPEIGSLPVHDLRRSHVAKLLDKVEDAAGPVQADRVRAYLHKAMAWWSERDDVFNFSAAFVKATPRANAAERARTRVLTDDEIRLIWRALDDMGQFGAIMQVLLLTAQRKGEVAAMRWSEIGADGVWSIPAEKYKTKRPNHVALSKMAREIIERQPKISEYVFRSSAGTPFAAFAKPKALLAKKLGARVAPWWTHDLRRTARSLMSRAGVRSDVAERVLGHTIRGVEGVYDRHSYMDEKLDALEKLAKVIENIIWAD